MANSFPYKNKDKNFLTYNILKCKEIKVKAKIGN